MKRHKTVHLEGGPVGGPRVARRVARAGQPRSPVFLRVLGWVARQLARGWPAGGPAGGPVGGPVARGRVQCVARARLRPLKGAGQRASTGKQAISGGLAVSRWSGNWPAIFSTFRAASLTV